MSQLERKDNPEKVSDMVRVNWRYAGIGQIPCKVYLGRYPDQRSMLLNNGKRYYSFDLHKDGIVEEERRITESGEEEIIGWVRVRIEEIGENLIVKLPVPTSDRDDGRIIIPQEMIRDTKVPKEWVDEGLCPPNYMCH